MTPDAPFFETASPAPELFGPAWAERLERELGADESYRSAAASWKGSLAFSLLPDGTPGFPAGRGLFLDLAHGNCRAARPALPAVVEGRVVEGERGEGPVVEGQIVDGPDVDGRRAS